MGINFEVKGMLARLLATEDIVVEHRNVETAFFNVKDRILTLPLWEKASNNVYDLLLSHEAAHALYTPADEWCEDRKIPLHYVNIVEDARIEKLMKRRYAGLSKTFYLGYKEMADDDYFELQNNDVSKYNLADRANLYFKIGNHLQLKFNSKEQSIIDLIGDCETFEDSLNAAEILFNYCKENVVSAPMIRSDYIKIPVDSGEVDLEKSENDEDTNESYSTQNETISDAVESDSENKEEQQSQEESHNTEEDNGNNEKSDNKGEDNDSVKEDIENDDSSSDSESKLGGKIGNNQSTEVKTVDKLNEAIQKFIKKGNVFYAYLETPKLNLDEIIVPCSTIDKIFNDHWKNSDQETFLFVDTKFKEFKQSAQKEVNFLVKEFESKKAADSYTRALTSRTGILDCSKLHTYKLNDDLFKKITTLPDGKNHGLIFILDWSGSMSNVILDTIKQLFNLIWFCKKVSIPFEVYAFTNEFPPIRYDSNGKSSYKKYFYEEKNGLIQIDYSFSLMNFLSSQVNTNTLNNLLKNIFRIAYAYEHGAEYRIPSEFRLSGTPLNESIIALQEIIPNFKTKYKLQKVQCIILTDGDNCPSKYHIINSNTLYGTHVKNGINQVCINSFLRNRKTGNIYKFTSDYREQPSVFLKNLRDMYTDVNFIGFRIISSRDASYFIRKNSDINNHQKLINYWKEHKSCAIKNASGYHMYFGICSSTLSQDSNFNISENATKSQIKNAFMKSLNTKKTNKKILTEFVKLIV